VINLIAQLRGGIPECCDFCRKAFTQENYPTPEEGGEWACIECVIRWDAEYKESNKCSN